MITRSMKKILILFTAVFTSVYVTGITVCAVNVPDMARNDCSVSVTMQDPETEEGIQGETLALCRVAEVHRENDADYSFELTKEFADSKENLNALDNGVLDAKMAERLNDYRKKRDIRGTKLTSDASGRIVFEGLKVGLYLIYQEEAKEGYYTVSPFLVSIPYEENGEYIYDVEATPKMEIKTNPSPDEPETPEKTGNPRKSRVKTGDTSQILLWGGLLALSALGVTAVVLRRRRKE